MCADAGTCEYGEHNELEHDQEEKTQEANLLACLPHEYTQQEVIHIQICHAFLLIQCFRTTHVVDLTLFRVRQHLVCIPNFLECLCVCVCVCEVHLCKVRLDNQSGKKTDRQSAERDKDKDTDLIRTLGITCALIGMVEHRKFVVRSLDL